jgi:hypothetical protein
MVDNADRADSVRAAGHAALVVPDQPVSIGELPLGDEWRVAASHVRSACEQHGIARTLGLILQRDVAELCSVQCSFSQVEWLLMDGGRRALYGAALEKAPKYTLASTECYLNHAGGAAPIATTPHNRSRS